MQTVDVALFVLLAFFAVRGFLRGFFRESFGLLALGGGILAALLYAAPAASALAERVDVDPSTCAAVAFVAIFLAVHTVINLFGLLLDRIAHSLLFGIVSSLTGALFGVLKGAVFAGFVLLFLQLFPIVPSLSEQVDASRVARPLTTIVGTLVRDYWQQPVVPIPSSHV